MYEYICYTKHSNTLRKPSTNTKCIKSRTETNTNTTSASDQWIWSKMSRLIHYEFTWRRIPSKDHRTVDKQTNFPHVYGQINALIKTGSDTSLSPILPGIYVRNECRAFSIIYNDFAYYYGPYTWNSHVQYNVVASMKECEAWGTICLMTC